MLDLVEQFSGRAPDPAPAAGNVLRLDASTQFHYLHHPLQWDVTGKGDNVCLIPRLRVFRMDPGVSGVIQVAKRSDGNGIGAIAERKQDGWIEIPRQPVKAWGKERPDYCLRYDGHRGPVHAEAWRKYHILGSKVQEEWDQEGWVEFLNSLVQKGAIPPISGTVKQGLYLQMRSAAERRVSKDHNLGSVRRGEVYEFRLRVFQGGRSETVSREEPPKKLTAETPIEKPALPNPMDEILKMLQGLNTTVQANGAQMQALTQKVEAQSTEMSALRGKVETVQKDLKKASNPKSSEVTVDPTVENNKPLETTAAPKGGK